MIEQNDGGGSERFAGEFQGSSPDLTGLFPGFSAIAVRHRSSSIGLRCVDRQIAGAAELQAGNRSRQCGDQRAEHVPMRFAEHAAIAGRR